MYLARLVSRVGSGEPIVGLLHARAGTGAKNPATIMFIAMRSYRASQQCVRIGPFDNVTALPKPLNEIIKDKGIKEDGYCVEVVLPLAHGMHASTFRQIMNVILANTTLSLGGQQLDDFDRLMMERWVAYVLLLREEQKSNCVFDESLARMPAPTQQRGLLDGIRSLRGRESDEIQYEPYLKPAVYAMTKLWQLAGQSWR